MRQALHEAMAARVAAGELPGLVTLVASGDDVHVDAIGAVALDAGAPPMRRDSLFRIASLTKPMLAAVTLMLVEDGVLDLAEPVDRLLPELADRRVLARVDGPLDETVPARRPITVDDLLTFRLGFGLITEPTYQPPYPVVTAADALDLVLGAPDPRTPHEPDEWIRRFGTLPLMYQPGERWMYNAGSLVLGVLVARAGGAPLGEVLRARLFEPLGMVDTGFWTDPANLHRIPVPYASDLAGGPLRPQTGTPLQAWGSPPAFPSGAGGLLSTVDDVYAFARLLRSGGTHEGRRLLSAESVAAMTTNQLTAGQLATAGVLLDPKGWGYGMSAVTDRYGWAGGSGTVWCTVPARDLIAVALSQTTDFLFNGGAAGFLDAVLADAR